jgi:hypothetical protein
MKRAAYFILLFSINFICSAQNLVVNPGFEVWNKITKPDGWTTALGCLKDSMNILSESYSCRQEATTESRDLKQKISVYEGKTYRVSLFYKTSTGATGNGCRVWCSWLDSTNNELEDPLSKTLLHSNYLKSETWHEYSADVIAPAGAIYFNFLVRTLPNSVTWWDDFVFEDEIATASKETPGSSVKIFPNPVSDYLTIKSAENLQHIAILNLSGATVWSSGFSVESSVRISISSLQKGIYIIRITYSGKMITKKIIKN